MFQWIARVWGQGGLYRFSLIGVVVLILGIGTLSACDTNTTSQQANDQKNNNDTAIRLHQEYPYPKLTSSSELINELKRYHALNDDPNRISYIYLLSLDGKIIAEYQIIGKISSTDSLYSSPTSIDPNCSGGGGYSDNGCPTVPAAQPDGSYGANEPGVYFFIDDSGHTMVEWNGTYLWSLNRIPLVQPPSIVITPNGR